MTVGDEVHVEALRQRVDDVPARRTAGIRAVDVSVGRGVYAMDVPDWAHSADGVVAPGVLAILADTAIGTAVMSAVTGAPGMVTSHLHLELLRPIPPDTKTVRCEGTPCAVEERFALGEGEMVTDSGVVVARVSLGAVLLGTKPTFGRGRPDATPHGGRHPSTGQPRQHRLIAGQPVHGALGTQVLAARRTGVRMTAIAARRFANSGGGVHGGFGVLMGERLLDVALRHGLGDGPAMRPVELRAAFLRPIAADESPVECRGAVVHLGGRLAAARGDVRDHDGRVAVLVDASYVPA